MSLVLDQIAVPESLHGNLILIIFSDCPQVRAIHSYHSEQPDEINLQEGEIIKVLRKLPDGEYRQISSAFF